jgi:hypothetical protein
MKNCLGSGVSPSQAEEETTNSAQYNPKEEICFGRVSRTVIKIDG